MQTDIRRRARRPRTAALAPQPGVSLQSLCIPCARFDASEVLSDCNDAFCNEFGFDAPPRQTLRRSAFRERFETFDAGSCCDDGAGCDGEARVCDEVFCPDSGRSYRLHWSRLAPAAGGGWLVTATNLTDRLDALSRHRAMQDQLLFTSRAMSVGEMATTLAHEINQPLAAIINSLVTAQHLGAGLADAPPRLAQALELARSQAEHAAAVVARLREFVRTREPRRERHTLDEIVSHVLQLLQIEAQKQRVRIRSELPATLPAVIVDRVMIEQVLSNLVRNAIEAMRTTPPAERRLTIAARVNADARVEVRVADRGCGLDAAEAGQVFAPFFTTKPSGMGIGLAICRSIVEYHEGSLYHEPDPEGGAVFVFTLTAAP